MPPVEPTPPAESKDSVAQTDGQLSGAQGSSPEASATDAEPDGYHEERLAELRSNLAEVTDRIETAARAAGRSPREITLVAVTKTWPAADVMRLAALGIREVGENRDQEARPKAEAANDPALRWHMIGTLQRNKAASVVQWAHVVESVDRMALVQALDRAAQAAQRELGVLIQVSLDDAPGRGGAAISEVPALAEAVAAAPCLQLRGVMAVAPAYDEPAKWFERLAECAAHIRAAHRDATVISAGMSGDLEAAIAAGATHVRLGAAVLGQRERLG